MWSDQEKAKATNAEKTRLEKLIDQLEGAKGALAEATDMLDMAQEEASEEFYEAGVAEIEAAKATIEALEFRRMFSGDLDTNNAFLDIQAGSGGTEAQDWAEMVLRMYVKWAERNGFTVDVMEVSAGEVAGIKSATIKVSGEYAFGWLRTETGVHRLVRKSPFDSGNRRHTSFCAVFVSPEIDDNVEIDINPADLRIDTYRASGAGGQHVNRTDSAVRITHLPTNIVVQCQNDRSQHKNKAQAMSQLRAKLYEREMLARNADKQAQEDAKAENSWGSQIRSYVLDDSRIKDLRTSAETSNTTDFLNGGAGLNKFIETSLKAGTTDE